MFRLETGFFFFHSCVSIHLGGRGRAFRNHISLVLQVLIVFSLFANEV